MPIYEYQCRKCSAHIEVMQKMSDKPLTKCMKCGGRLEKQWSSTSFQLKGTGWYVTDYVQKSSEAKAEAKEAKSTSKEEKSGKADEKSPKSESKSTPTESDTKATNKAPAVVKKGSSKNVSSDTSGD